MVILKMIMNDLLGDCGIDMSVDNIKLETKI